MTVQPNVRHRRFEEPRLTLVIYAEVDYVHKQGLGIGIVQKSLCQGKKELSRVLKTDERKYGIKRENFGAENVKTRDRAYMLALLHALGLACSTITKTGDRLAQLQEVKVIMTASEVVRTVNIHIPDFPQTRKFVEKENDKLMIKRVVDSVIRLSRWNVQVSIAAADGQDKALARARTLAKQKGSKACRSRQKSRGWREDIEAENESRQEGVASSLRARRSSSREGRMQYVPLR